MSDKKWYIEDNAELAWFYPVIVGYSPVKGGDVDAESQA